MSLSEDLRELAGVVEPLEEHGVEVQGPRSIQTDVEGELIRGGRPPGEALDRLPAGRRGRGTPRCPGGERVA